MLCGILSVVARPDLEYGDDITDNSCAEYSYGFSKSVLSSISILLKTIVMFLHINYCTIILHICITAYPDWAAAD